MSERTKQLEGKGATVCNKRRADCLRECDDGDDDDEEEEVFSDMVPFATAGNVSQISNRIGISSLSAKISLVNFLRAWKARLAATWHKLQLLSKCG